MSHKKVSKPVPFWRRKRTQNRNSTQWQGPSDDLPLHPLLWKYNVEAYENDLSNMRKAERNLAKLQDNLHPNQK